MRYCCFILLLFFVTSCNYFNVKKTSFETILNEELQTFNWNDIDRYPAFLQCKTISLKKESKKCFQDQLALHVSSILKKENIIVFKDVNDTIFFNFQISKEGRLRLLETKIDTTVFNTIPDIEVVLTKSLRSLPKLFPAIKRGQNVQTEFLLPIVISVK